MIVFNAPYTFTSRDYRQYSSVADLHNSQFTILLSQVRDHPNLEDQVLVFMSPRNRVVRLYPQAPSVSFYNPSAWTTLKKQYC
jgi:hypothetical protein